MIDYSEYCPIATGVEIVGDRWSPLVIRELMIGSTGFNEIHRGIPKINRTLLSDRLRHLERRGIVARHPTGRGRTMRYELTPAGAALGSVVWSLGQWAAEWVFGDPADAQLDGISLLWRMHQFTLPQHFPEERTVVHITLTGRGGAQGWLDLNRGAATFCKSDTGLDVTLVVRGDSRQMHRWMIGRTPFSSLVTRGEIEIDGPDRLAQAFPSWFNTTAFTEAFERGQAHGTAELAS